MLQARDPLKMGEVSPGGGWSEGGEPRGGEGAVDKVAATANKLGDGLNAVVDSDEGYLPQEFLSRAAIPEDEIDLQEIPPPGTGSFRMLVWINSRGDVARIDLDNSDVPAWFSEQVVDRFKKSRFRPGLRDEKPVASIMRVEVTY